ncbi:hypothetical protein BCR36DRAFT_413184 [Piromyces finnis]|uniref:Asteroid domain-containing protein n=1 Tax=Piromyces finnis TaxID=1754191 RepID=A0A1Y1V6N5_9FUNG|nr:hypothetical protein BCR36DRAFT_413184 [Piromyces finnis]|eukprot:ORX48422.1 hypothetical protein BCR36DRAFT_413184 [Piromyces finnis]
MGIKGLTTFTNKCFEEFAISKENLLKEKIKELEKKNDNSKEIKDILKTLEKELLINKKKQNEKCLSFDINMNLFNSLSLESDLKKIQYPKINKDGKLSLIIDANSFFFYFSSKINWVTCDYSNFIEFLKFYVRIFISIKDVKNIFFIFDGIEPINKINSGTSIKRIKSKGKRIFNKVKNSVVNNNIRANYDDMVIAYNPLYPPPLTIIIYMQELRKISKNLKDFKFPVNLKVIQAEYEADVIVAKYARKYNGFIIGNDSDYLIYESPGYIPLDSITLPEMKKIKYPCKKKWKIECTLWKIKSLCDILDFPSLYLPVFGTLCGNDYIDSFKIPMSFVKEYTETLINYYIVDKIEYENYDSKEILRVINKNVNIFNDKDTLKEALDDFPKLKYKINEIIRTNANKANTKKKKVNVIPIKDEDLNNIATIIYKKNYMKVLVEYLKKKISKSEKRVISNTSNSSISQEREYNKVKLIKALILDIAKDKNESEEKYQKLYDLAKVYISNDEFIEKQNFSEFINQKNINKISDYFYKGLFYGKEVKVLKYKTFHCSPYLENVFNDSCWEITNKLRKKLYSILFSLYGCDNENKSVTIEEYKRKKIELHEDEIDEIEESYDDEKVNSVFITVEETNPSIINPKTRELKYFINKYVKEDIIINLKNIGITEKEKFALYKKIFYSSNMKMNGVKKIFIPIATSIRFFIIETYKRNKLNAITEHELTALIASIVSSMSNLLGVQNTRNNNSSLKVTNKTSPLPKNKVSKMTLHFIHRFSEFQNIIFLNIFILSALTLLDSPFLNNKSNMINHFHEYCWAYGFHKFLEYFKTLDFLHNGKGEKEGPFHSNFLNNEFKMILNAVIENINHYIIINKEKPFLKYYLK